MLLCVWAPAWFDEMNSGVDISYTLNAAVSTMRRRQEEINKANSTVVETVTLHYGELEMELCELYKHNVGVGQRDRAVFR